MTHDRESPTGLLWAIARWSALAAVPLLLAWLVLQPASALTALWYVAIPILPASFFVTTALWRGICPLATLNELGNRMGTPRELPDRWRATLGVGGLLLFHFMVPARRFLFNEDGVALAATVAAVGVLAVVLGALFTVRSAFCNALCPVLPVELLYGMAPLAGLERGRCDSCTVCTPRGCLDLAQENAITQLLGPTRRTSRWLLTPYGIFFAALPGFIIGYNRLEDGPLMSAPAVYATTLGWSLASLAVVAGTAAALRLQSRRALALIAALSGGLYYWFAGPAIMNQLGGGLWVSGGIRLAGIGLVLFWLTRTSSERAARME